jgi:DNA mismatch repair protein MutS2
VPGASAGINIAQRLGLNPKIIDASRKLVSSQTQEIAHFLDRLQEQVRQVEAERSRLRGREAEIARERQRLESEGLVEQKKRLREMEQKLESLLKDFEYQVREAVGAVQERVAAQKLSKDAERRIAKLRREFKEQFDATVVAHRTGADVGDPNARPREVKYVEVGDQVRLKSLGKTAKVERKLDGDLFEVSAGPMKMRVPRSDIAEVLTTSRPQDEGPRQKPVEAARAKGINVRLASSDDNAASEINVIGKTVDEATDEVEKFVDRAFLAGLPRVRIVHGSGMGILRKALRSYLKSHPHVATVTEPPQQEGGAGATVVELRG